MVRVDEVTEGATESVPEMKPALDFTGPEKVVRAIEIILAGCGLGVSASVSRDCLSRPGYPVPILGVN